MKNKVIFFDMGNTLLDFHKGKSDDEKDRQGLINLTEYLNKYNRNITFDKVKNEFFKNWVDGIEDRYVTFKEYPIEGFLNAFLKKYTIELELDQCIEAINAFYKEYRKEVCYEDDIYNTLKKIKDMGYKIGIISNSCYYDETMKECFKEAGIYDLIDEFIFSYSIGYGKPDRGIFKVALKRMKVTANDAIMVGDSLRKDIEPALELGMKTIWFNNDSKKSKYEVKPDAEVKFLSEIPKYLIY